MNIKSSQTLVKEAQKKIETLNAAEVKKLFEKNEFDALFFSRGINSILESLKTIRR